MTCVGTHAASFQQLYVKNGDARFSEILIEYPKYRY